MMLNEGRQTQKSHTISSHWCQVQDRQNESLVLEIRIVVILEGLVAERGHERDFCGEAIVVFLDAGACFTDVFISCI